MSIMPPGPDSNQRTSDRRAYAAIFAQITCDHYRAAERSRRYFLRQALAYGVTIDELCTIAGIDHAAILELTDPAAD